MSKAFILLMSTATENRKYFEPKKKLQYLVGIEKQILSVLEFPSFLPIAK